MSYYSLQQSHFELFSRLTQVTKQPHWGLIRTGYAFSKKGGAAKPKKLPEKCLQSTAASKLSFYRKAKRKIRILNLTIELGR
ncbi:MAG: hypothetical protein LBB79_06760 [Prevotellaceae bacterium]|jgi:hypothetical protein|nr:hypothetical protein [Prevotellaceae bacterium]